MYDELVKRLREEAEWAESNEWEVPIMLPDHLKQAADAIEELSKMETTTPRWISVEERLPEQKINQNTLDFEYVLCATTFGDVRPYKYGRRIGQGDAHFWNGAGYVDAYVTHWKPLPEPPKEE